MKKKDIINLIKYHTEKNEAAFRNEAYSIAKVFDQLGDYQLSEYIMALLSDANTFVPQLMDQEFSFFTKIESSNDPLPLPEEIKDDILGVINAIGHNVGMNKFLFQGFPGTGKTETVKQVARILERQLFSVEFDSVIDSKLGQTSKNIKTVFEEINRIPNPTQVLILFDELDSIALDRINSNDLREMGRVTSTILKELDKLNDEIVIIATTNLYESFDKALVRRFDSVIDFNRYSREDLVKIAEIILNSLLEVFKYAGRNMRLFKKAISTIDEIPYPGDLKNLIKTALAFSSPADEFDYIRKILVSSIGKEAAKDVFKLHDLKFTLREIEILTSISKSQISRTLKGD